MKWLHRDLREYDAHLDQKDLDQKDLDQKG